MTHLWTNPAHIGVCANWLGDGLMMVYAVEAVPKALAHLIPPGAKITGMSFTPHGARVEFEYNGHQMFAEHDDRQTADNPLAPVNLKDNSDSFYDPAKHFYAGPLAQSKQVQDMLASPPLLPKILNLIKAADQGDSDAADAVAYALHGGPALPLLPPDATLHVFGTSAGPSPFWPNHDIIAEIKSNMRDSRRMRLRDAMESEN